ncbi:hypothetical protein HDZ31DRAFT_40025 [Schizophyllum fasciatum]
MATKLGTAYSVNTWRTRYALKYKGLAFATVWLELPDVERELRAAGAPPSGTWPDGRPKYTVPTIFDPATARHVTDAHAIARYLDATYGGDRPALFPRGTAGVQRVFVDALYERVATPAFPTVFEAFFKELFSEPTQVYFRATREKFFGRALEEMWEDKAAIEKAWEGLKAGLDWVEATIRENGEEAVYLLGNAPVNADFAIASLFQWYRRASPARWEEVKALNGGRWVRFMESMRQYEEER